MANLYCSNHKICSLFDPPTEEPGGGSGRPIAIGEPLTIRYLHFRLHHRDGGKQQLMISTFAKAEERKGAAAEAINYYNPEARFSREGEFRLSDFGGQYYGHPLCYYTKSYLGESIRLTTKVMELDRMDRRLAAALRRAIATVAGLPISTSYVAYTALVQAGFSVAEKIIEVINRDDSIINSHSVDLHFDRANNRRLQPGRVVCIPDREDGEFLSTERWALSADNRLVDAQTGGEYADQSYFVLQVKAEENPLYEKFDYFQNVAELLEKTNRGGNPAEFIEYGIDLMKGYSDFRLIEQMEALALVSREPASRQRVAATFKLLSPLMQKIYETRAKELVGSAP
ncbi:hypothetical protein IT571_08630 [Candidatus Sumerlaeota bacterium]|nr:hypothetical protein [Candidatus Sumerlaeota bacterium]